MPPLLIVHLKRFYYAESETRKLYKHIAYRPTLKLAPAIFSPATRPHEPVQYHLYGIVFHHGKSATDGHYTCAVRTVPPPHPQVARSVEDVLLADENVDALSPADDQGADDDWLYFDDSVVSRKTFAQVQDCGGAEYLLFYQSATLP